MDKLIGLYNLSRKYCMDRINYLSKQIKIWQNKFLNIYEKTKNINCDELRKLEAEYPDINIREDILRFILEEIEKIVPEDYKDENKLKEDIISACENANIRDYMHYSNRDDSIKKVVSDEEKLKFRTFINSLNEKDLFNVQPLFYRRILSKQRSKSELESIEKVWDVFNDSRDDIIVYDSNKFLKHFKDKSNIELFRKTLTEHGIKNIIEIEECGEYTTAREIEVSVFEFNSFSQGYWLSEKKDWVIYKWHEDRCFVGGKWLLDDFAAKNYALDEFTKQRDFFERYKTSKELFELNTKTRM